MPAQLKKDAAGNWILPPGFEPVDFTQAPQPDGGTPYPSGTSPSQARLAAGQPLVTSEPAAPDFNPVTDFLGGATDLAAKGVQATGLTGGPFDAPNSVSRGVARAAVPQTPVELGMFIAALPIGGGTGNMIGRVGRMALGGMAGGSMGENGETGTGGAVRGAIGGLIGEGLNKVAKMVTYAPWVKKIAASDTENVGKAIADIAPDLGSVKTPDEFQRTFSRAYGQRRLSEMYDQGLQDISGELGDQQFTTPTYGKQLWGEATAAPLTAYRSSGSKGVKPQMAVPFEVAIDKVRQMRLDASRLFKAGKGVEAAPISDAADSIESEVLGQLPQELQDKYNGIKTAYAKGQSFLSFFRNKGVRLLNDQGGLDMESLQGLFKRQGLGRNDAALSAAEIGKFQEALFRGAEDSTVTDMASSASSHARLHKFGVGFSIPLLESLTGETRFVGNTPFRGNLPASVASVLGGRTESMVSPLSPPISLRRDDESK